MDFSGRNTFLAIGSGVALAAALSRVRSSLQSNQQTQEPEWWTQNPDFLAELGLSSAEFPHGALPSAEALKEKEQNKWNPIDKQPERPAAATQASNCGLTPEIETLLQQRPWSSFWVPEDPKKRADPWTWTGPKLPDLFQAERVDQKEFC